MRNGNILKSRVSEICVEIIHVYQGVGVYSQLIQLILSRFWVQLYCESLSRLQARSYVSRHQISDPIRSRKLLSHQKTSTRKAWDLFFGTVDKRYLQYSNQIERNKKKIM